MTSKTAKKLLGEPVDESYSRVAQIMRGIVPSIRTVGIVTAENPMGQPLGDKENKALNDQLEGELRRGNFFGYHRVTGKYNVIEHPFLIPNIQRDDLLKLGTAFKQKAVIYGESNRPQSGYAKMSFEYWGDRESEAEPFKKSSERDVFVSVDPKVDNFYTEVRGRKFVIPFFDDAMEGAQWIGGTILKKSDLPATPQVESLVLEIERRLEEDFSGKVGYSAWGNRGILWARLRQLRDISNNFDLKGKTGGPVGS